MLTEAQPATWQALYPAIDVLDQCRQALAWLLAHPNRQKTARGMPTFCVNWFSRSVNSGKGRALPPAGPPSPARNDDAKLLYGHFEFKAK